MADDIYGKGIDTPIGHVVKTSDVVPEGASVLDFSNPLSFLSLLDPNTPQGKMFLERVGVILLGSALCIVGIVMLVSGTKTAQTVVNVVKKVS